LLDLFQHLGIERAHIVAGGPPPLLDWYNLATLYPERVSSLTLISPPILDTATLAGLASRLLTVAGDPGPHANGARKLLADLPSVSSHILRGYDWQPWSDVIAESGSEIGPAMLDFLDRHSVSPAALAEGEGEAAGISYRIRGAGPPLVLMPLSLAPSQWEPLIATLSARYCTIALGGPLLGVVSRQADSGQSAWMFRPPPGAANSFGMVHGGVLGLLAHEVASDAQRSLIGPGEELIPLDLVVNFYRGVPASGRLAAATAAGFFRRRYRPREAPGLGGFGPRHHFVFQFRQSAQQFAGFKGLDDESICPHPLRLFRLERLQLAHAQ